MLQPVFSYGKRGLAKFWSWPWKVKGPVLGFGTLFLLVAATSGGAEERQSNAAAGGAAAAAPASPDPLADTASPAAMTAPSPSPTAAQSTPTPTPTATSLPPTQTPTPTATPTATAPATPTRAAAAPPPPTATPTRPAPTNTPVPAPAMSCTLSASVSDPTPPQNGDVTLTAVLSCTGGSPAGATVTSKWRFKSTTSSCDTTAGPDGIATCTRSIGAATKGYTVVIDVTATKNGMSWKATTSFTPR